MSSRRKEHRRTAADKKENHGKPDDSESQPLLVSPTTNAGGGRGSSTQQQQQQQHGLRAHPSQQQQHNRRTSSGAFLSAAASTPSALSPVRPLFGASSSSSIGGPMSAPYNIQQYAANSSNSNNSNTSSLSMLENTELDAAAALAFSLKPVSGFPPTSNISTTTPSKNSNNLNSSGAGGGDIGAIGLSTSSTSLTDQAGEGKFGSGQNRMHRYHRPSTATSDPTGLISSSSATSSSVILLDSSSSPVAATIADSVNLTPAPKTPPVLLDQRQHFLAMGTGNQPRMYVEDSSGNELDDDDDTNSTTSKRGSFTRTRSGMRSGGVEGGDGSGSIFKGYVDFEAISDYLVTHSNVQQLAATAAAAAATGTGFSGLPHRRVNSLNTEDSTTAPSIRGSTKRNSSNLLLNNYGSGIGGMGIGGGGPISSSRVLFYSDQTGVIGAKKFESLNFYSHYYASSHYTQGSGGSAPLSPTTSELSSSNAATNNSDSASYSYSVFLTHILQSAPFWIDVTNPSSSEMNVFRKLFGIHPLTAEDIETEDGREKCEVFPNYFFVCIRTFDPDPYSMSYLHPINLSLVVYRNCILSFHRKPIPHPQNVLQRIEQLKPYGLDITPDWINYAIIDDITDSFMPLLRYVEFEVESIDELVLILNESEQSDMLRRIGKARKNVLLLLRLLGTKADVLKNIIKRCSEMMSSEETWLYLSDIQDHVFTMVQNLTHYEKTLSRSHSNYLAQISIEITQASNRTNEVVMKMTAIASILVPLNVITGLWGMNVLVPWQDTNSLIPFFAIIFFMLAMTCGSFWYMKRNKVW